VPSCAQRKPAEGEEKKEGEEGGAAEEEAEPETGHEKTHFHGKSERDYAGNSWIMAPKDKKKENDHCFLPKRWIHTWCVGAQGAHSAPWGLSRAHARTHAPSD
jgi:pre-mRNA-processing factor 17